MVSGSVYGAASNQLSLLAFEFIPDSGWYALSNCSPVPIQSTGQFSVTATTGIMGRYATRFSAYIVPASLTVPCVQGTATIPFIIQQNALSVSTVPRIPQYSTVNFGGLTWYVKTAPLPVTPGPQFFIQPNAFVDNQGQLHLRITQCADSWCAAEIFSTQTMGYGTYTFTVNSPLNDIDPNVTLGLFPWDAQAGDHYNREWDIEFGRWGNANASANAQYVVQPYNGPNNLFSFLMSPASPLTHTVVWQPNTVEFQSSASSGLISQWTYPGSPLPVPTPGDVHLHMNLYVARGQAPAVPIGQEIIISNFQYTPYGPQVRFSRTADTTSFLADSYLVPISATGPGCSATIESDSPWISIVGPNPIQGGGTLQYTVPDNIGTARTGNLILQSTNCNATLGSQILSVTQPGLVCSPSFVTNSTSIGFLQTMRSVFIRGTASECSWSVTSSSPWLNIVSSPSGSGDGSIQFSAAANADPALRQGLLSLNNSLQHWVYQDASGSMLALSPLAVSQCGTQMPQFGVSWVSPGDVEIRLNAPTGQLVGQYGPSGSALLPQVGDGTLVYLVAPGSSQPLGSALTSVLPTHCGASSVSPLGIVNSASFTPVSMAPGSLATIFGSNLSAGTATSNGPPYPISLGGISVTMSGESCPLVYVSPSQVNFLVPSDLPTGRFLLSVNSATADALVTNVSPGIFTLNAKGTGVPLASVIAVTANGTNISLYPYQCTANGCAISAIGLPTKTVSLYFVLYGTGIRNVHNILATLGSVAAQVVFYGSQLQYPGLDQVNVLVKNLSGLHGHQSLVLQTDGMFSNAVDLLFL